MDSSFLIVAEPHVRNRMKKLKERLSQGLFWSVIFWRQIISKRSNFHDLCCILTRWSQNFPKRNATLHIICQMKENQNSFMVNPRAGIEPGTFETLLLYWILWSNMNNIDFMELCFYKTLKYSMVRWQLM